MLANKERLAQLITLEVGKTITEARGEVAYAADYVRSRTRAADLGGTASTGEVTEFVAQLERVSA